MLDASVLVGPLPKGSFFAWFADGDRIVRDDDFAACFRSGWLDQLIERLADRRRADERQQQVRDRVEALRVIPAEVHGSARLATRYVTTPESCRA
jgi:hypothetical protein